MIYNLKNERRKHHQRRECKQKIPAGIKILTNVNPLSYGVDGLCATSAGTSHFGILLDINIVFTVCLLVFLIGVYLFSKIEV